MAQRGGQLTRPTSRPTSKMAAACRGWSGSRFAPRSRSCRRRNVRPQTIGPTADSDGVKGGGWSDSWAAAAVTGGGGEELIKDFHGHAPPSFPLTFCNNSTRA